MIILFLNVLEGH